MPAPSASARGRGRPTVVDPTQVAEAAIMLWSERGYQATGWKELSDATGVSERTLIRHFASRAEIPWVGVAAAVQRLEDALADIDRDVPLSDAIREAVVRSVSHTDRIRRVSPSWLALVDSEPELRAAAPRAYSPWIEMLAAYIAERNSEAPAAVCHALATAYQAAAFAALTEWANDGALGSPDEAVDAMLRWFDVHRPAALVAAEENR